MASDKKPFLPPRFVVRFAWRTHRALYRWSGGKFGLRASTDDSEGYAHLTTTGRRSGQEREVMIAYFEHGNNYVTMAMNGWGSDEPAWWLNLQANERGSLTVKTGTVEVTGRAAEPGEEHDELWQRWCEVDPRTEEYSKLRTGGTTVVVLSPIA